MPLGKKSNKNKNKSKAKQNDHPQPIQNVDLPETKLASNSDSIGTWDTLGKDGDQDRQRRPSKTSGASRKETSFGPDVLFDQDEVTPPPGKKKPTVKSMAHKIAKTVRGNKGASSFEDEHPTPLSPTTCSQVSDEATSVDVHSPRDIGSVRNGSGLEGVSEHPLLSPNRIPTLESYIEPSQDKVGGTAPQLEKAGSAAATQQRDTSPSTAGPLSNTPGQSEEQIATHSLDSSGDKKKQEDGLARAAQGSRDTSQDVLGKKIAENRKLKGELKLLQEELAAKETTRKDLATKLDERDIAHDQHLKARLSDIRAAHKIELEAKETLLQAAVTQKENDRQTAAGELAKRETELKEDLKNKEDEYQNVLKKFFSKDTELQTLKEEMRVAQSLSNDHAENVRRLELQLEETKDENERLATTHTQAVADLKQQLTDELEKKHKIEMEVESQKGIEEVRQLTMKHEHEMKNQAKVAEEVQYNLEEQSQKKDEEIESLQSEHARVKEQLIEDRKSEIDRKVQQKVAEAQVKHEEVMKGKALQIEDSEKEKKELSSQIEKLQQEIQDNRIQFEQAATAAVKEARQKNDEDATLNEDQRPTEKLRAQIEAEVEEKHRERVTKEMAESLEQAQELIREKDELANKLKDESEQRAKQLQEEHEVKVTELTRKHNEESRKQKKAASDQARTLEQTYLTQLEVARKQHDQEMTQGQGLETLKAQLETKIEAKYHQKVEESQRVKEEELTRHANEIEHLSQQLKNAENEIQKVQESKKTMQDAEHLLMQEAVRREQEIEQLKNELKSQVEILGRFQHENEHLKGQYRQLEVHAQAKQELSVASFIPSEGDDGHMFHTPPVQQAISAAAVPRDTEVTIPSSLVVAAHQISKFIDNEAFIDRAKKTKLDHPETVAITQAIGLPAPAKRRCYVFAVFPTNLHDHSVVLDYTGGPQTGAELESVVEAAHQHGADGGGEEEEQFFDTNETLTSQQMADDNRTDAEKLKEVLKESESLRDELEKLTTEHTIKKQELEAANAHLKEVEGLHGNLEVLTKQVQELKATNAELKEAVRFAAVELPASPVGVQQGDEASKMVKQFKAKYIEQVTKTVEGQEKHNKELEDLVQQHKREKQEWWTSYEKKKQELIAKIEEKDKENKQLRNRSPTQTHPELGRSFSYEEPPEDVDPRVHVGQLKQALKSKEEKIEELNVQVRSFQEVASQHKQLKSNSKAQSTTVMNLRRELKKTQTELAVARSESESAKKIQDLNSKVSEVNLELEQLQRAKNEIEDERNILRNEISAEKNNNDSLKKQLAQSQTMVATLRTKTTEPVGVDHKDQEIQLLKTEENLYQIELEELRRNDARSKRTLAELGRSRFSLERKLANVSKERDGLAQQNLELQAKRRDMKGRLDKVDDLKTQVDVTHEHVAVLRDTVVTKTEEVNDLKEQIERLKEELDASRFQAQQYEEDFKEEREAREQAIGTKNSDFGRFTLHVQELSEELVQAQEAAKEEREQKQAVITKLESAVGDIQQLTRQSDQADKDYQHALETKGDELRKIADEKAQLMGQMEQFRNLSQRYKQQLERAEQVYQQRQAELEQDAERLIGEAEMCKTDFTEKAQLVAVEKLSLEEQLAKVNAEFKLKEKQLEIMATEKAVIDQQLGHEKTNTTALTLELDERKKHLESMATEKVDIENELSRVKANSAALAMEVREGRQQLETTIADTSRLSDEVLAKTQQVRQYNKQTDSYKAKLEETTARLQEAKRELQNFQEQNTRIEEDHQNQIEVVKAQLDSDKLTAERELTIAKRKTTNLQVELREWKTQKMSEGQVSEIVQIEIKKREEAETKLEAAQAKCNLLFDKCDDQFKAIEVLKQTLTDNRIRPPRIDVGKISTSMQNVQAASRQQPRPQATPHVSQHASQYDQHPGYNQPQQGANQYQPIRAVAPSTPNQPFYNMPGQQQRPPPQHNQQVYESYPTQSLRPSYRSMTAPQAPVQVGENDAYADYMNIPADQIPAQQQNQQPLHRVQEDGSEQFQHEYAQKEQRMPGQGARQMMGSSAQGRPPHPSPYNQAPSSSQGRSREREHRGGNVTLTSTGYAPTSRGADKYGSGTVVSQAQPLPYGGAAPSEQHRGQDPNYPYNQQYPPTNQPNEQYPATSQGYQPSQQYPQINEGYQGNQGYAQANSSYPKHQQHLPTNQTYNSPNQGQAGDYVGDQIQRGGQDQGYPHNQQQSSPYDLPKQGQAGDYVGDQIQRGGQDQGYPHNQQQSPPYDLPNQGQAGCDQMPQVLGAGVRSQDPQPHRARVGSQGAQGPSPQGPYGGGTASVPPNVQKVPGNQHPIPVPRSGRRAVQELLQSQPSPPMNQHAHPDQLAQHSQPGQPDQLAQPVQATRPDQPVPRVKEDTNVQENVLLQGIDDDIHQAVEEVQNEDDENEASLSGVPFDPNLVCPLCMKQFRLGEIQKYKKHVGKCQGQ